MLKLSRFLKPFAASLILAIVLLFIQAICELNLPNYMSKIVNVGIQQGGVEEKSPRALSQNGYKFITTFMSEPERTLMQDSYQLVSGDSKDSAGKPISKTYPKANTEQIYVLKQDLLSEDKTKLDAAFGSATWTMLSLFEKVKAEYPDAVDLLDGNGEGISAASIAGVADTAAAGTADTAVAGTAGTVPAAGDDTSTATTTATAGDAAPTDTTNIQALDFTQVYQLQPLLDALPPEWLDEARTKAAVLQESFKSQSGQLLIAGFYRELGCDMTAIEMSYIIRIGLYMLAITILAGIATVLVGFISARVGAGVGRNMRQEIFAKVTGFSHTEFDRFSTASLITRSTNDVTVITMLLTMGIRMICYAPIMGIGGVYMALGKSVSMSWIIGVAAVVLVGIMLVLFAVVMPKFRIIQTLIDRLNLVARETLNGLMVIRAFSREDFEEGRFEEANKALTKTNLFVGRAMTFMMPVLMLFMNGLTVLIIWVGAHQVAQSHMQVGDMMAYMQYVMQIIMSFMFIAMMFVFIPRALVSAKRINEVLQAKPSIVDPAKPLHMDSAKRGLVQFDKVSFRFEGANEDALSNISFTAKPGQTTALIGSTGSGKSTIVNLIPRFYDATQGLVLVGGVDVRQLTQQELRSSIGYVPQQSALMAGTIESNITYGSGELSQQELETVAQVAQALDFINESEERFDLPIAQSGSSVSGGQRQRLAIARALAVKPDIYLFDDSFSALDFATDAALRKALASYTKNSTLIIVAQRISTIREADQIIVIDEGKIVGLGTHQELLSSCDAYYEIASSQLSEHELVSRGGEKCD